MTKKLDTNSVESELKNSAFFSKPSTPPVESSLKKTKRVRGSKRGNNAVNKRKLLTKKNVSKKVKKQVSKRLNLEDRLLNTLMIKSLKPNTFRYSQAELDFIRDVVYEADINHKTKIDKNDVARIALEWLMNDYKTKDKNLIVRLLTKKKARGY